MTDVNGSGPVSPSNGHEQDRKSAEPQEADPRRLEREIEDVRARLDLLVGELDRRRHEVTDVALQVRKHPVAATVVAAAAVVVTAGVMVAVYRLFLPDPLTRRARKLALAMNVAGEDPDKLLRALEGRPDPRRTILSALLDAGVGAAAKLPLAFSSRS